jgi:hypothetical protein
MYFIALDSGRMNHGRYLTWSNLHVAFYQFFYTFQTINSVQLIQGVSGRIGGGGVVYSE